MFDLFPPIFLDMLAMEQGDYGASISRGVRKDPNNPNMCIIEVAHRIETLEQRGWEGFESKQL